MKVAHLHLVPLSFWPLGPNGLAHIQNDRPQLMPAFLVNIVLQGSSCSQSGATGLRMRLPQLSLATMGSIKGEVADLSEVTRVSFGEWSVGIFSMELPILEDGGV